MTAMLRSVTIPDFGTIDDPGPLPPSLYDARANAAYAAAGVDWLIVYADREHMANVMFLSGFEPRFEEALLLLGPAGRRVLVTGNECVPYAALAPLPGMEIALAQTMSLLGQDRSAAPRVAAVLRAAGLRAGDSVGVIGWKYAAQDEAEHSVPAPFVPAFYLQAIDGIVGVDAVRDCTPVLLHPETGQRSIIDADQIAVFEAAAARGSAMVWNVLSGIRPGDTEFEAAARASYRGEPMNVHMMLATGDTARPVNGLCSPGWRRIAKGDGASTAVGMWGGLSARAGLIDEENDDFVALAAGYFAALVEWYRVVDIGVAGGDVHDAVVETLARAGLRSLLNPGHLTGHEEWSHTPFRPGSSERLRSGMHVQVDVIPTPLKDGWALNCEDGIVLADATLRDDLARLYPSVWTRIQHRRRFIVDMLGVPIGEEILPLSSTPLCLAPLWLRSDRLFVVD